MPSSCLPGYRPVVPGSITPAPALRPAAHPDAPLPGTPISSHNPHCYACGDARGGLRLTFTAAPDLSLTSAFTVTSDHQGAPGLAHGGVLSAVFDEALGVLQVYFREPAVTASLTTQYRRPVPVGSTLHIRAWVDRREGRKLWLCAVGHLDAPDGPVAVEASGLFLVVPHEHFEQGRPSDVAAARGEPGVREVNP
jgi:acyl-coenzyme A thioesterase PaaI-like protein